MDFWFLLCYTCSMKITVFKYGQSCFAEHNFFEDKKDSNCLLEISFLFYLIEWEDRRLLIDVGCNDMSGWDMKHLISPALLIRKYGLSPLDITDVIITHAHHDHIGCAKYFRNAVFYIQRDEYETGKRYLPEKARLCIFDKGYEISENIKILTVSGHSKGSSAVLVNKNGEKLLFCGDEVYSEECFLRGVTTGHPFDRKKNRAFIEKYRGNEFKKITFHTPEILPNRNGFIEI